MRERPHGRFSHLRNSAYFGPVLIIGDEFSIPDGRRRMNQDWFFKLSQSLWRCVIAWRFILTSDRIGCMPLPEAFLGPHRQSRVINLLKHKFSSWFFSCTWDVVRQQARKTVDDNCTLSNVIDMAKFYEVLWNCQTKLFASPRNNNHLFHLQFYEPELPISQESIFDWHYLHWIN